MKFAVITMKNGMPNYAVSDVNPVKHPFNEDDTLFVVTKCIGGQLSEHWFTTSQIDAETAFFDMIGDKELSHEDTETMIAEWEDTLGKIRVEYKQIA